MSWSHCMERSRQCHGVVPLTYFRPVWITLSSTHLPPWITDSQNWWAQVQVSDNPKMEQMNSVLKHSMSSQDYSPVPSAQNSELPEYPPRNHKYQMQLIPSLQKSWHFQEGEKLWSKCLIIPSACRKICSHPAPLCCPSQGWKTQQNGQQDQENERSRARDARVEQLCQAAQMFALLVSTQHFHDGQRTSGLKKISICC